MALNYVEKSFLVSDLKDNERRYFVKLWITYDEFMTYLEKSEHGTINKLLCPRPSDVAKYMKDTDLRDWIITELEEYGIRWVSTTWSMKGAEKYMLEFCFFTSDDLFRFKLAWL